ncbi:hypothetical protein RIE95_01015 [Acidithiobacillus thiooxidans]|uniref:hypothetical protein n=1 Tax=Acidithiobacillus thiooxidans TaxID=930 RepID=UPI0028551D53|nr:hypothetical protein [Acidithiobacillus thiooxidans]MDR7925589.1 hypothetical protein [Acidithiobacillus thiooxidans]
MATDAVFPISSGLLRSAARRIAEVQSSTNLREEEKIRPIFCELRHRTDAPHPSRNAHFTPDARTIPINDDFAHVDIAVTVLTNAELSALCDSTA